MTIIRLYHPNEILKMQGDIVRLHTNLCADGSLNSNVANRDIVSISVVITEHLQNHLDQEPTVSYKQIVPLGFGELIIEHIPSNIINCSDFEDGGVVIIKFMLVHDYRSYSIQSSEAELFLSYSEAYDYYKYYYQIGEFVRNKIANQIAKVLSETPEIAITRSNVMTSACILCAGGVCRIDRIKYDAKIDDMCDVDFVIFINSIASAMKDSFDTVLLVECYYNRLIKG